jgi:hypothetical protein
LTSISGWGVHAVQYFPSFAFSNGLGHISVVSRKPPRFTVYLLEEMSKQLENHSNVQRAMANLGKTRSSQVRYEYAEELTRRVFDRYEACTEFVNALALVNNMMKAIKEEYESLGNQEKAHPWKREFMCLAIELLTQMLVRLWPVHLSERVGIF